jgi:hypothetical protein
MEGECQKMRWVCISSVEEGITKFIDSYQLSAQGCSCPFFLQYEAPCVHLFKCAGRGAFDMLHPGWIISDATIAEPIFLHGPIQAPRVTAEDRVRLEAMALAANVHSRLLDLDASRTIDFARKFLEMIDRGSLYELPATQDPPASRPRGRPRNATRNTFNGNPSL